MHGFQRAAEPVNHIFTRGTIPPFVLASVAVRRRGKDGTKSAGVPASGREAGEASLLDTPSLSVDERAGRRADAMVLGPTCVWELLMWRRLGMHLARSSVQQKPHVFFFLPRPPHWILVT